MIVVMFWMTTSLLATTSGIPTKCPHKRLPSCTHIIAYLGFTVALDCSTLLNPSYNSSLLPKITWYKFGRPLSDVTFRSEESILRNRSRVLLLENLLHADAGTYVCVVLLDGKRYEKAFSLSTRESKTRRPPYITNKHERDVYSKRGQNVALKCKARSGTTPYFQWFHNKRANLTHLMSKLEENVLIKPRLVSAKTDISRENGTRFHQDLLWIYNISHQDSGIYVCLVFTKHGKDFHHMRVSVEPEPLESSTELKVQQAIPKLQVTTSDGRNSINSKIPMIILIALPAGLFILSCSAVIRSLEKSRQARLAKKQGQNSKNNNELPAQDGSFTHLPSLSIHTNFDYCNHLIIRTNSDDIENFDQQADVDGCLADEELDQSTTTNHSEHEADLSSCSPLDVLSNASRPSSCHVTSTEAPLTSSPPHDLSSSSIAMDLEWEGLDLVLPIGSELVQMSKEVDV